MQDTLKVLFCTYSVLTQYLHNNSRCKITTFFANTCVYIIKKCVKIDTFCIFVTFYTYFTPS